MQTPQADPRDALLPGTTATRVFREVNERIRALAASAGSTEREFICECADPDCLEFVPLTLARYDAIRATARAVLARRHMPVDGDGGGRSRARRRRGAA